MSLVLHLRTVKTIRGLRGLELALQDPTAWRKRRAVFARGLEYLDAWIVSAL